MPRRRPLPAPADQRLDPFRERGAALYDDGGQWVGSLFLRVEQWSDVRGVLWWKRFSNTRESVHGYFVSAGGAFDDFLDAVVADDEVEEWSHGQFRWHGQVHQVVWADTTESLRLRDEIFGLDPATP